MRAGSGLPRNRKPGAVDPRRFAAPTPPGARGIPTACTPTLGAPFPLAGPPDRLGPGEFVPPVVVGLSSGYRHDSCRDTLQGLGLSLCSGAFHRSPNRTSSRLRDPERQSAAVPLPRSTVACSLKNSPASARLTPKARGVPLASSNQDSGGRQVSGSETGRANPCQAQGLVLPGSSAASKITGPEPPSTTSGDGRTAEPGRFSADSRKDP